MMKSPHKGSSQEGKLTVKESVKEMTKRVLLVAELVAKANHEREIMQLNELRSGDVTQEGKAPVL